MEGLCWSGGCGGKSRVQTPHGSPLCQGGGRRGCPASCSSCSTVLPSSSPEASQGKQDSLPGTGGIFWLRSALGVFLRASQSTAMGSSKRGPTGSRHWAAHLSLPSWHHLKMPESCRLRHWPLLDMCTYCLLTCNYSRNRYLSTGLLYIM